MIAAATTLLPGALAVTDLLGRLLDRIAYLERSVANLSRQVNNTFREARVLEVDAAKGLARVEAHGARSKMVPWLQRAGDIRDWDPPTPGERVVLMSPTGEPGKGLILPGGYSDQFPQPHDKESEARRLLGDTSVLYTKDRIEIASPLIILKGKVRIQGPCVTHNGINIGDDHAHQDVEPGPGLSGPSLPKDC